jgi:hypothetical protein
MSEGRRGGERRRASPFKRMQPTHARSHRCMRTVDASFARSFDPCSSILTMHAARKRLVVGRSVRHHGWANPRKWEEPTLGLVGRTLRGSPRVTASARRAACHVEKRKEVEASVPARIKSPGWVARTSCSVAEVGRRRRTSNKLGIRAPKRAVRVE